MVSSSAGIQNPYHSRALSLIGSPGLSRKKLQLRRKLRRHYAYSVPNQAAIETLVRAGPLVEIGAGLGYWARLVGEAGGDILCFDPYEPKANEYGNRRSTYAPVREGSAAQAAEYPERTFVMMWPDDYNQESGWSDLALEMYLDAGGDRFIFVGEDKGGASGSDRLFELAERRFQSREVVELPTFEGIHDALFLYH